MRVGRSFLCLVYLTCGSASTAGDDPYLVARNLAPLRWVFLQPVAETPDVLHVDGWRIGLDGAYASVFHGARDGSNFAVVDGESATLVLRIRYGVSNRMDVGVELPYRWMGNGSLDGVLVDYHGILGLPQGDRPEVTYNTFQYEVRTADGGYTPDTPSGGGLGDVVIQGKWSLSPQSPVRSAVRAGVKIPTGDPDAGLGSGHLDAGIGVLGAQRFDRWGWTVSADALWLGGSPDSALNLGRRWSAASHASLGVDLWSRLSAIGQLQYTLTPYATGLRSVDEDVWMLVLGLKGRAGASLRWSVGITEDVAVETSPDISLFLSVEWCPGV